MFLYILFLNLNDKKFFLENDHFSINKSKDLENTFYYWKNNFLIMAEKNLEHLVRILNTYSGRDKTLRYFLTRLWP